LRSIPRPEAVITFDNCPYLCSSEDGKQIYIEAGSQEIDLAPLGMDGEEWVKDRMVLGIFAPPRCKKCQATIEKIGGELPKKCRECGQSFEIDPETGLPNDKKARGWNLEYQTEKKFDDFEPTQYQHDLGEPDEGQKDRKEPPYLEYEPRNKRLYVTGGNYIIRQPFFGMSPGIEN